MEIECDHYDVLGLPSDEEGAKLSEQEINKAYRSKARELHPDKRPDDPNAHANFLKLKTSYDVLKDEKARKLFDNLLKSKRDKLLHLKARDSKRRKMMSDLEERERSVDPNLKAKEEEERISRKLNEEITRIRKMYTEKMPATSHAVDKKKDNALNLDKRKILKVSWKETGGDYTVQRLRKIFEEFGTVEDVVIKSHKKKKESALVVMANKEAAAATIGHVLGDLSNPLLVLPLQPASPSAIFGAERKADYSKSENLVGVGYRAFEDLVLEKLKKAAKEKK
ncbi:uncharacterized protein LOC127261235 [Andrographis paniculata]|uniref:uncharacterized protein LOC127261235 n=1 Tax=Andrographis paniculata TaxID=175694 RepID=UPI0021E8F3CD|nr:uncharacterized protein LOC127261235 [Andrographis paniculata]